MHLRGQGVARCHLHPDTINGDPARDNVRRVGLDLSRIAGFAIGHDEQAVGAVAKLFFACLQQRIRAPLHVIPQRRPASGLDAVDRPGQHALLARAKRINPVAPWEHQDADMGRVRDLLKHLLERVLGHGHASRAAHGRAHRAGGIHHHHDVVGHLHLRLAKRRGPKTGQHRAKQGAQLV